MYWGLDCLNNARTGFPANPSLLDSVFTVNVRFQSLMDRGVGVNVAGGGWGEEEERKPRPIGTERAWKLTAPDDWHQPEHDRYQVTTLLHRIQHQV